MVPVRTVIFTNFVNFNEVALYVPYVPRYETLLGHVKKMRNSINIRKWLAVVNVFTPPLVLCSFWAG
jgi:hypothetical protein